MEFVSQSPGHFPLRVAYTLHPCSEGRDRAGKGWSGTGWQTTSAAPTGKVPGKLLPHRGTSQKASNIFWISSHSSQNKVGRSSGGSWRREQAHPSWPVSLAHRHQTAPAWSCEGHEEGFVPLLGCRAISSPLCRCGGQHEGEQGTKYCCCWGRDTSQLQPRLSKPSWAW